MSQQKKEQGNFTVEFAIVAVFFSMLLVFSGDIITKLSVKGKLDRMSYSVANIVKERTQLFDESSFSITESEYKKADAIAQASLSRTLESFDSKLFGSVLEVQTFNNNFAPNDLQTFSSGNIACDIGDPLSPDLSVITSWGRKATLYRITLCYETDNWFGELIGGEFKVVNSRSIAIGR